MRSLYVVLGLLLGMLFTTNKAIDIMDQLEVYYIQEIGTYTLVGYQEGWQRGRDHTYQARLQIFLGCMEQLNYAQEYIQELRKGCPKDVDFKWGKCK